MLKHKRENRIVNCLVCWKCHGRAGPNHFTLKDGGAVCEMCGEKNPLTYLRKMPLGVVQATYEIIVCFGPNGRGGMKVHGLHVDAKTALSHWKNVDSEETLVKMLAYIGATEEQIAEYHDNRRRWGQGSFHCRLLPQKRNLLGLDYSLL